MKILSNPHRLKSEISDESSTSHFCLKMLLYLSEFHYSVDKNMEVYTHTISEDTETPHSRIIGIPLFKLVMIHFVAHNTDLLCTNLTDTSCVLVHTDDNYIHCKPDNQNSEEFHFLGCNGV
jgi:hypothetical protein